jgi:membrane protein DedA with SNARE-associated domain
MQEWIEGLHWGLAILFFWGIGILRTSLIFMLGWIAAMGGRRAARIRTLMDTPLYRRAEAFVNRWGVLAVPACFLTVGFQTAVIVTTGFTRMPLVRWIPAMLVGTLIWGTVYGTVGMAVVWAWLERPWLAGAVVAALLLGIVAYRLVAGARLRRARL